MKTSELEILIRMAAEADALAGEECARDLPLALRSPGRLPGEFGAKLPVRTGHSHSNRRMTIAWPAAIAAAVLLAGFFNPRPQKANRIDRAGMSNASARGDWTRGVGPLATRVSMCYTPGNVRHGAARVDHFQPSVADRAAIIAIFRAWNSDCGCLLWQLHRDDRGAVVLDAAPGESLDIPLPVEGVPAIEQLLLLAVSKDRAPLNRAAADDADKLLECLNSSALAVCNADTTACASAVQQCLPSGVTVVPQAFVVHPR